MKTNKKKMLVLFHLVLTQNGYLAVIKREVGGFKMSTADFCPLLLSPPC